MDERRRSYDPVLQFVADRLDRIEDKQDQVLGLGGKVDSHDRWIETDGKRVVKLVDGGVEQAKGGLKGVKLGFALGLAGAGGGAMAKLLTILGTAWPK